MTNTFYTKIFTKINSHLVEILHINMTVKCTIKVSKEYQLKCLAVSRCNMTEIGPEMNSASGKKEHINKRGQNDISHIYAMEEAANEQQCF